jgi:hypothetical protein
VMLRFVDDLDPHRRQGRRQFGVHPIGCGHAGT